MKELLKELSETFSVSGRENRVAEIVARELKKHCDSIETDRLGNVIAVKKGKKPAVMLAAHMDEIGLVVKHIDEKGFIRFGKIGGVDDRILPADKVVVHTRKGPVNGVIGFKPPHLLKEEDRKVAIEYTDLFVDIGAKDKKDAEKHVELGDYITLDSHFSELQNNCVTCKSFDNRAGVLVLIETMKRLKTANEIFAVFTVQEEVGLKGARTSAFGLKPDMSIVIDTNIAGDHPNIKEGEAPLSIGAGPIIELIEAGGRGLISDARIKDWLVDAAKKSKVGIQISVDTAGSTDGAMIYISNAGVPTCTVSIPTRYIHSPAEVLNMKDVEDAIKLITAALGGVPALK